jgi:alkylation response protein AidB-like acyl-CoA dehydrogenase
MTENDFISSAKRLLSSYLSPRSEAIETADAFPEEAFRHFGEYSAYGIINSIPAGGLGLSAKCLRWVVEETAWHSATLALVMGIPTFAGFILLKYASEAVRKKLGPEITRGQAICAFAYTEIQRSQQGPGGFVTQVRPHPDGYVLNGVKNLISLARQADYLLVVANYQMDMKTNRPALFLVPAKLPGVRIGEVYPKMAFGGLELSDIAFEEVLLPLEALLGRPGLGLKYAEEALLLGRLCASSVALGLARRTLHDALHKALQPRQPQRLADLQAVQTTLGELKLQVEACGALIGQAWLHWEQENPEVPATISMAKIFAARTVQQVCDRCLQLAGGSGYLQGNVFERRYRQARIFHIIEGTSEILLNQIAKRMIMQGN